MNINEKLALSCLDEFSDFCSSDNFKGWDPYDGLNSKVFNSLPLKYSPTARLVWIQLFKRSPINLRKLFRVEKGYNPKALALLLTGFCNVYELLEKRKTDVLEKEAVKNKIVELSDLLLELKNPDYTGACWGYNFDWQSKAFYLPKGTPTVVATSFVVEALLKSYELTKNRSYLDTALSSSEFVLNDLNRIEKPGQLFMFSYSPLDTQAVYNASLLGTKILSLVYSYTKDEKLKEHAYISASAVCNTQNDDGSFPHSDQIGEKWRDNFHTGFKLESLYFYQELCSDNTFENNIKRGFDYWISSYFDTDSGFSFYYDRDMNRGLVDLHCAGQALSTFFKLEKYTENADLIDKIAMWPIKNMKSAKGYFYFQKGKLGVNKTAYLRWPNAWMFYGLSYWLLMD
ncbi:hypothetical protein [Vibrio natriegens]|uniref:hypothetical protein n=1 Tax=Vibrio natriegens TaxID=691 RepID=UPI003F873640